MKQTVHLQQRMSQRGVSRNMVDLVLEYGTTDQDKHILGRKEALFLLDEFNREMRALKKIVDKGGVVVVVEGDALVTTYNCEQGMR